MGDNSSGVGGVPAQRQINDRVIIVQALIAVFLCINFLQLQTFFKKELFRTTMRYMLFAMTLLSDSLFLILTNILLILSFFGTPIELWLCVVMVSILSLYSLVTPITLTAMTLERYVAICMPLRHGELCTTRRALHCILIIHSISFLPMTVVFSGFFASAPRSMYKRNLLCSVEVFNLHNWQAHFRSAVNEIYFLIMSGGIVFSYVKIVQVARFASGENKKSSLKGLKTVSLHLLQLILCFVLLWCPFIEAAVLKIDFKLYIHVRYLNYIFFILAPRCLSPLIYGLRDEKFLFELKHSICYGWQKKKVSHSSV